MNESVTNHLVRSIFDFIQGTKIITEKFQSTKKGL